MGGVLRFTESAAAETISSEIDSQAGAGQITHFSYFFDAFLTFPKFDDGYHP